jgi:hypothetical protein
MIEMRYEVAQTLTRNRTRHEYAAAGRTGYQAFGDLEEMGDWIAARATEGLVLIVLQVNVR